MKKADPKEHPRSRELRVLQYWKENDTFRESVRRRQDAPPFVFYEGPPTANGAPHIGHVLGRVIKDCLCRYRTMAGYRVVRKAGWDTHGLPVELGVEKQLGISGKQEIESYGVEKFVERCKNSVFEYEKQWRELTEAIGYWTDLDNPYVTLSNDYIESVWHLLSAIHRKGLLYRGHRVSPYCPSCQTTLSSHEVAQGYEDVKDLSATVRFRLADSNESLLAWTTTPWTLPANTALAVNRELDYVRVKQRDETLIVAANLADRVLVGDYEVVSAFKGAELVGRTYEPPFRYASVQNGHIVIDADFVRDTSGTGIVHIAPAYGEDDDRAARRHGIDALHVVDAAGRYSEIVADFAGRFVKDCDADIVKLLSARGLLYAKEKYEHSYPFCWRCKTPLLYYASNSWFIRTTAVKEQLVEANRGIDWYPEHLRDGRFGRFLDDVTDWNISRSRYWGTPLNVWVCGDCQAEYSPDSVRDLREHAAHPMPEELELHKPHIDGVRLVCPQCRGTMTRTPEVVDVWFDSGSMPFAQHHYPFENEAAFREQFPADLIVEGIDQTRGWFYSLLAVSTLYAGKAPYKAVMATGHVLDENGQKMSKSKGNVIDPWEIIGEYGTDAFRWALLSDSAPWNNKRFSRQHAAESKSKVIDTLHHTHVFYTLYAEIDRYRPEDYAPEPASNPLDRWILSRLNRLVKTVSEGLESFDLLHPAKEIEVFIDELSNWYVRRSRDRFWGGGMTADKIAAFQTLREALLTLSRLMAPYTPFLAEDIFLNLGGSGSVHLADYPECSEAAIDPALEEEMEAVRRIVELARGVRNDAGIKTRQPLSELVVSLDENCGLDPARLEPYADIAKDELNVKRVRFARGDRSFVCYTLKLNLKVAGPKYGKRIGAIQAFLRGLDPEETSASVDKGFVDVPADGGKVLRLTADELLTEQTAKPGFASAAGYRMTVALNVGLTPELVQEGTVREVVRIIQDQRKKLMLPVDRRVKVVLDAEPAVLSALERFEDILREHVLLAELAFGPREGMTYLTSGGTTVGLWIG